MILKSWGRGHRVKLVLVAVPLGIYWVLAAQMSWRPRTLIQLDRNYAAWSLFLSADGKQLVLISGPLLAQPSVSVWTSSGKRIWSSDAPIVSTVSLGDGKRIIGSYQNQPELHVVLTKRLQKAVDFGDAISGNYNVLSANGRMLASGDENSITRLYDLSRVTQNYPLLIHHFTESQNPYTLAFSADSLTLATTDDQWHDPNEPCEIRLWDTQSGKLKRRIQNSLNEVMSVSFSPDGEMLASVSAHGTKLWNYRSGNFIRSLATGDEPIAFSPDGKVLASGSKRNLKLWDVQTGALLRELVGHSDTVNTAVFSPDGATLLSGSEDGTVRQWRIK